MDEVHRTSSYVDMLNLYFTVISEQASKKRGERNSVCLSLQQSLAAVALVHYAVYVHLSSGQQWRGVSCVILLIGILFEASNPK